MTVTFPFSSKGSAAPHLTVHSAAVLGGPTCWASCGRAATYSFTVVTVSATKPAAGGCEGLFPCRPSLSWHISIVQRTQATFSRQHATAATAAAAAAQQQASTAHLARWPAWALAPPCRCHG